MKNYQRCTFAVLVLLTSSIVFAQTHSLNIIKFYEPVLKESDLSDKELKDNYLSYDFSPIWNQGIKYDYKAYIGKNFQRIRIRIFSIVKDIKNHDIYYVYGKSALGNKISPFQGIFMIEHVKRFAIMHWGVDDVYKNSGIKEQGIIIGKYNLYHERTNENSGYFEGTFSALWYIDRNGELQYDNIENHSDSFRNNQFIGTWKSYNGSLVQKCNWGDYRIPDDGDLDNGAGGFFPNRKYAKFGWESYIHAYESNNYKLDAFNWNQQPQ